ncbi:hypothetical protein GOL95_09880 [Sinorhizobium medicae]|nr:hypothetical protein [Sinorhizobium medicae]
MTAALRLKVLPRFPARIEGTDGVKVTRASGSPDLNVSLDFENLGDVAGIADPDENFFAMWDRETGAYRRIPFQSMFDSAGVASGYPTKAAAQAANIPAPVHAIEVYGEVTVGDGEGGLYIDTNNGSTDTFTSGEGRTWYRAADVGPDRIAFPDRVRNVLGGFDTEAAFISARIPAPIMQVETAGYTAVGDGGGHVKKRISTPGSPQPWQKQSADGSWWEIASERIAPEMLGAAGDGIANDGTAVSNASSAAVALGKKLLLLASSIYLFTQVTIAAGCEMESRGAVLRSDGTLTVAGDITLTIGDQVKFDELAFSTPGTETNEDIIRIGANVRGLYLEAVSDTQRAGGGIVTEGDTVQIGYIKTRNIDRPLHLYNTSTAAQTTGSVIGFLECESRVRAFRATFCSFKLGGIKATVRSANASKSAGHNTVLIVGCSDWEIGDIWAEDTGEHDIRFGTDGAYRVTQNWRIGRVYSIRSGGCVLKINPTFKKTITGTVAVTSGSAALTGTGTSFTTDLRRHSNIRITDTGEIYRVLEVASDTSATLDRNVTTTDASSALEVMEGVWDGEVASVVGVDVGDGSPEGNEELIRLTHAYGVEIGPSVAFRGGEVTSAQSLVRVNDICDVEIASLGGDGTNSGSVIIDGTSDVDGVNQFGGDITDFRVNKLYGQAGGADSIGVNTTFNLNRVTINLDNHFGFTTNLLRWTAGVLSGPFNLRGTVAGSVPPAFVTPPDNDNFTIDLQYNNARASGRTSGARFTAIHEIMSGVFSASNVSPNGFFVNATRATAGLGNYGAALELSRPGSSRRGAAVVVKQTGASGFQTGLAVMVGNPGVTGSDALVEGFLADHLGNANVIGEYQVDGTRVVGNRVAGWAAATGTATRTTFATSTVTTAQLAERVKALIDDLTTHGLIGA